jgi:hypothetical protein
MTIMKHRVAILWVLLGLFLGRVYAQTQVAIYEPVYLPSMQDRYSGLVPYPLLLFIQLVILMLMAVINYDHSR